MIGNSAPNFLQVYCESNPAASVSQLRGLRIRLDFDASFAVYSVPVVFLSEGEGTSINTGCPSFLPGKLSRPRSLGINKELVV